ncbi:glycosyltransferase [Sutcliffiella sp. NPDC057660]|uniref:glycosyltransferase n=1 Tax=Sutcliffiella sp. NPDC057660 TaxID=3346199 RepID=UPI00368C6851
MKLLWISSIAWINNGKYRLPVNGPGAVSGSLFQQNIIEGLEEQELNIAILSDFPTTKKFNKGFKWSHNKSSNDYAVGSFKIPLISMIIKTVLMCFNILKRKEKREYSVAVAYLIHTPYLIALWFAKKLNNNLKTILICPDLPGYMDMSLKDKPIKSFFKKVDYWVINKLLNNIDAFILFSDAMREQLPIKNKKTLVIEGVYSPNGINFDKVNKKKSIMHAGTLHKNIGIENIIEGFKLIEDKELELWIFGDGELNEYIQREARKDRRIKFFGFVSRTELFEYQKQATLLINARNSIDDYTKYSFPSKTFEYMVSGTPFLTTKLSGIPEEYYDYLYTMDSNAPSIISDHIKQILAISDKERELFGLKARDFVLKNKNKNSQSTKMKEFLRSINSQ